MRQILREHLAQTIALLRPDWGIQGIRVALDQPDLLTVNEMALTLAALRCAADEKNRTPAVIGMAGSHWQQPAAGVETPIPPRFERPAPLTDAEYVAAQTAAQQALHVVRTLARSSA